MEMGQFTVRIADKKGNKGVPAVLVPRNKNSCAKKLATKEVFWRIIHGRRSKMEILA
jgi:hypothetical protein